MEIHQTVNRLKLLLCNAIKVTCTNFILSGDLTLVISLAKCIRAFAVDRSFPIGIFTELKYLSAKFGD